MADLFKSAVNYLSGSGGDPENEFVGKVVVLGRYELRVKKLLGGGGQCVALQYRTLEYLLGLSWLIGGFSYVYVAEDTTSGEDYALKVRCHRFLSDRRLPLDK